MKKSAITFLSVQELHGLQEDHLPTVQSIGTGLFTARALLTPASLRPHHRKTSVIISVLLLMPVVHGMY